MSIIKITNFLKRNSIADYKGLDLDAIVAGTQIYLLDSGKNEAYFHYDGELIQHEDIHIIAEEEYLAIKQQEESKPRPPSTQEELDLLRTENEVLTASLIDFKTQYMGVPCQYHQDYPVVIDKVIEEAKKDGTV